MFKSNKSKNQFLGLKSLKKCFLGLKSLKNQLLGLKSEINSRQGGFLLDLRGKNMRVPKKRSTNNLEEMR